jgi:hypothetical protein
MQLNIKKYKSYVARSFLFKSIPKHVDYFQIYKTLIGENDFLLPRN